MFIVVIVVIAIDFVIVVVVIGGNKVNSLSGQLGNNMIYGSASAGFDNDPKRNEYGGSSWE